MANSALPAATFLLAASSCSPAAPALGEPGLVHVATWTCPDGGSVEILDVQARTGRVAVTSDAAHSVTLLDLTDPRAPRLVTELALPRPAGELTSCAFHPELDVVLVVVEGVEPGTPGVLRAFDVKSGAVLASAVTGVEPDAVTIDATGRVAAVACEAESYRFDGARETYRSGRGSVSFVDLGELPETLSVRTVELDGVSALRDAWSSRDRFLERDIDRDAQPTEHDALPGRLATECEPAGKKAMLVPITDLRADVLEPEYSAFSPDGARLYVTLQENDLIAVFDVAAAELRAVWDLGVTQHATDLRDDGKHAFTDELRALREPDALALTPDGRYVVTADEGDSSAAPTRTPRDAPSAGGRTLSVFDAATGELLGDTGAQLDQLAAAAGVYPDKRSDKKGCEPEGIVAFDFAGATYAAVGLERADAVALVSLADPRAPRVVCVTPLPKGSEAPEGIDVLARGDELFVLTANEDSDDVTVFALTPAR